MLDLLSELRNKVALVSDLLWLAPFFSVIWVVSFCFQPLRTLRETRDLLRGEYTPRYSYSVDEEELDWIDELWMEDRR